MTDRLRKFFRLRGKTAFSIDEVVAPVVLVQDLTKGPYQAGVTPCAGERRINTNAGTGFAVAVLLNDKVGSVTPVLGREFNNRSFSATWADIQNNSIVAAEVNDLRLGLTDRAAVIAAGIPTESVQMSSIQNNDGTQKVPVEIFLFNDALITVNSRLARFALGDNVNTLGTRRTFDDIQPNITIGPEDVLVFVPAVATIGSGTMFFNIRGFYQEQPA